LGQRVSFWKEWYPIHCYMGGGMWGKNVHALLWSCTIEVNEHGNDQDNRETEKQVDPTPDLTEAKEKQ